MSNIERFVGKHAWMETTPDFKPVTEAILSKEGKELAIVYRYMNRELGIRLKSEDGINFIGEYESDDHSKGACRFRLYKNSQGALLVGSYSENQRDGSGMWLIELMQE